MTSNACNAPHPLLSLYAASKWALEGWAEGVAMELAPFGIELVVVQPGAHRTPFARHVVPVMPEGSAYARWLAEATPGIGDLDDWGRSPDAARGAIVAAVAAERQPFRTALGEDAVAFSVLKASLPYEARAAALRAIVGLPGPNAFLDDPPSEPGALARHIAAAFAERPALVAEMMALLASRSTETR